MKFTLKDYQRDAVEDILENLERGRVSYRRDDQESSFALTAPTGAGKTVMAAAAIEALFYGSDEFDFDADPGAVVVWFSDSPALNDQTRTRLQQASERFTSSDLVTIQPPFARPRLDPGKVYFLNAQRLSKNSLLTRGHVTDAEEAPALPLTSPDLQGWTIWETLANTINDPALTVYLILDEAHRGFDKPDREKPTIVRRLVSGHAGYPPVPIVWGISATIERFRNAMKAADADQERAAFESVSVDPGRVQESGLVKDTLLLDIPTESGDFDTVLVRRGARKLREQSERWEKYARRQKLPDVVQPLLVLQTPNKPDPDQIGRALDAIFAEYPALRGDAVRHVLGDHKTQHFGAWTVDWIEPQRVETTASVRVLVAKDAISTGWDCPRAEVMVSFRTATDNTHITQLLGRMVRSPLAMRVPGDDRLNAVDCILPRFDRTTAGNVVRYLTGQLDEMPGNKKRVVYDGRDLIVNPAVPESVWRAFEALATETLPQKGARPVKRLVTLAQALSADRIRPGALAEVEETVHRTLDAYGTLYGPQLDKAVQAAYGVAGQEILGTVGVAGLTYKQFVERADDRAILSGFEHAKKAFGADIAQSYMRHLAGDDGPDGDDDGLRDAHVKTAALSTLPELRVKVDAEAGELARDWFEQHREQISELPDLRRQEYEEIRAMTTAPERGRLEKPKSRIEDFAIVDDNEQIATAPLATKHLMADKNGEFPLGGLNSWELEIVEAEVKQCVGWYRNPARRSLDSLAIAYRDNHGDWRSMHPDFVFFQDVDGQLRPSIVDPHGHHLDDAELKLKALAAFAERYGDEFDRIEAISLIDGALCVLNMQKAGVREAVVRSGKDAEALYRSDDAEPYAPAS